MLAPAVSSVPLQLCDPGQAFKLFASQLPPLQNGNYKRTSLKRLLQEVHYSCAVLSTSLAISYMCYFFKMLPYSSQFARSGQAPTGEMSHVLGQRNGVLFTNPQRAATQRQEPLIDPHRAIQAVLPLHPLRSLPSWGPGYPQCTAARAHHLPSAQHQGLG